MVDKIKIGDFLRQLRTEKGLTQEELAEKFGVSSRSVSKWESGASDPSTTNLMALAKLFGVSAEDLLKEAK